jgi:hypothetical protein
VRLSAAGFFSAGAGGLVGDAGDNLVLDCYWLARWYHQCPDVFLAMPLSQVRLHIMRTQQIANLRQQANDDDG